MAVKAKAGASSSKRIIISQPKTTRQGNGKNSKPSHGRKLRIGQGKR
jgi:hypothetical protein